MIQLKRIGYVLLRVFDVERSRTFYSTIFGFEVVEEDFEYGGIFMVFPGQGHILDIFQVDVVFVQRLTLGGVGVYHVAFQVDSDQVFTDVYFSLFEYGVKVTWVVDYVSQKSIYFYDFDDNLLEIYYELPNVFELFW